MYAVLIFFSALAFAAVLHRIRCLRQGGHADAARRCYGHAASVVVVLVWLSMLCQEAVLLLSGAWTLATGLPFHLCAVMGLLTAPALLGKGNFFWQLSLYLGMAGALAALLFPCPFLGAFPFLARLSFGLLHTLLLFAPLLPLALGRCPAPRAALTAWLALALYAGFMLVFNRVFHTNYLFLSAPPASLPPFLSGLSQGGWVLLLAGASIVLLAAEGLLTAVLTRRRSVNASKHF